MQLKNPVYNKLCTLTYVYRSQYCGGDGGFIVAT